MGLGRTNGRIFRQNLELRITNLETDRNAGVEFLLRWELVDGLGPGSTVRAFFPERSEPWTLTPKTTAQKYLIFPIDHQVDESQTPRVEVVDHISGRHVSLPAVVGLHDRSTWRPLW
jgi:hypothetical protein